MAYVIGRGRITFRGVDPDPFYVTIFFFLRKNIRKSMQYIYDKESFIMFFNIDKIILESPSGLALENLNTHMVKAFISHSRTHILVNILNKNIKS